MRPVRQARPKPFILPRQRRTHPLQVGPRTHDPVAGAPLGETFGERNRFSVTLKLIRRKTGRIYPGTGGSSTFIESSEAFPIALELVRKGYGVIGTECEEAASGNAGPDGKIRWNSTAFTTSNVDLQNLQTLFARLERKGLLPAGTPKYALGMSNGGAQSLFLGTVSASSVAQTYPALRFKAVVAYCADGSTTKAARLSTTPSAWYKAGAEDNPEVSNSEAKSNSLVLSQRGIPTRYIENPPSPVFNERFCRVAGISADTSTAMVSELRTAGYINADGFINTDGDVIGQAVADNPGQRATCSHACHEIVDFAIRVAPQFLSGRLGVDRRVGWIVKLSEHVRIRGLSKQALSLGNGTFHALGTFCQYQFGPVNAQQGAAFLGHGFWHGQNEAISTGGSNESEPNARVATGGFDEGRFARGDHATGFRVLDHGDRNAILLLIPGHWFHPPLPVTPPTTQARIPQQLVRDKQQIDPSCPLTGWKRHSHAGARLTLKDVWHMNTERRGELGVVLVRTNMSRIIPKVIR